MALAVTIQLDFKDAKNKTSFTRVHVPTGFTIAQYITFAQDLAEAAKAITTGRITGVSVNFGLSLAGATLTNVQNVLADVSSKALFQFTSAIAGLRAKFFIPTFDEDNLVTIGTDDIDVADVGVAAFITAIEDGYALTGGQMTPRDKRGNDLVTNNISRELFSSRAA
jgi:hypothetical protein